MYNPPCYTPPSYQPAGLAGWRDELRRAAGYMTGGALVLPALATGGAAAATATSGSLLLGQGVVGTALAPLAPLVPIMAPAAVAAAPELLAAAAIDAARAELRTVEDDIREDMRDRDDRMRGDHASPSGDNGQGYMPEADTENRPVATGLIVPAIVGALLLFS